MKEDNNQSVVDELDYQLQLACSAYLGNGGIREPEELITTFTGKIVGYEPGERPVEVARITFSRIHVVTAMNERTSLYEVLDSEYDPDSLSALLFVKSGIYSDAVARQFSMECQAADLIILDSLEILPPFRGQSLTRLVLEEIFRRHSDVPFVAGRVRPAQFRYRSDQHRSDDWVDRLQLAAYSQDEQAATDSLSRYLRRCGFESLPGLPMLVAPNPALTTSPFEELPTTDSRSTALH
jgi:hypothetical protein